MKLIWYRIDLFGWSLVIQWTFRDVKVSLHSFTFKHFPKSKTYWMTHPSNSPWPLIRKCKQFDGNSGIKKNIEPEQTDRNENLCVWCVWCMAWNIIWEFIWQNMNLLRVLRLWHDVALHCTCVCTNLGKRLFPFEALNWYDSVLQHI